MSAWQPIETAPKEGEMILACSDGSMVIGYWATEASYKEGAPGWTIAGDDFCFNWPTHWQPLPEPPTPEATRG